MNNKLAAIVIRDIDRRSEMREVEDLQKEIWGVEDREVFPALAMIPLREVGAILIGAFDQNRLIGFVFAFPGWEDGHPIFHSDMLAVKPAYRSLGLGYQLKLVQRERALAKSIERITWTFDPLQAVNAHFNFEKLGVVAYEYKTSFYGETSSFLHRTGTDRLWVTWLLNSERVKQRIEVSSASASRPGKPERVTALVQMDKGREPLIGDYTSLEQMVVIEIPADFNRVAEERIELATRWRQATRKAFTEAINAGYFVEEFYFEEKSSQKIGMYLLTRNSQLPKSQ